MFDHDTQRPENETGLQAISVERCLHAPYYGEWVLRQGSAVFGSAPGWLSHQEADARLRATFAVIIKARG